MGYQLGVDLGTTYTAAAVCRDGQPRPEVVTLGSASSAVPSVVFLGPDGAMIIGEPALRRALTEPRRIAREFKRRIGDDTPLHVGGIEIPAHELAARFLARVVDEVAAREGGPPDAVSVTHPVEWGEHKRATFAGALAAHGLGAVTFLTEPQAAAVGYASTERVDGVVGVYDLGGGTFDAAVVRKLADGGFELLGQPTGIERLGGIDFDDAVLAHVRAALGDAWTQLDATDPRVQSAVAGLRRECVTAKEALSADTEVLVPVMLPGTHTEVRLGRAEFEDMIRPAVGETVEALRRAIASAGLAPADLDAVLLVGGSSRIPLVSQMVSAELGRAVAVDSDPKIVVAAGAALAARELAVRELAVRELADPGARPKVVDVEPAVPLVEFSAPPVGSGRSTPRRRTLVLAASVAVVAALGLSAAAMAFGLGSPQSTVAQALGDEPGTPASTDLWTGAPRTKTTTPGPQRPDAVAATVRPVGRAVGSGVGAGGVAATERATIGSGRGAAPATESGSAVGGVSPAVGGGAGSAGGAPSAGAGPSTGGLSTGGPSTGAAPVDSGGGEQPGGNLGGGDTDGGGDPVDGVVGEGGAEGEVPAGPPSDAPLGGSEGGAAPPSPADASAPDPQADGDTTP